jgi:hypothetical protein
MRASFKIIVFLPLIDFISTLMATLELRKLFSSALAIHLMPRGEHL